MDIFINGKKRNFAEVSVEEFKAEYKRRLYNKLHNYKKNNIEPLEKEYWIDKIKDSYNIDEIKMNPDLNQTLENRPDILYNILQSEEFKQYKRKRIKDGLYFVYRHLFPDGHAYIGITKQNPIKRWNYGLGYIDNDDFYNALKEVGKKVLIKEYGEGINLFNDIQIVKVGWRHIKHQIFYRHLDETTARCIENELITYYKDKGLSYNQSKGGIGTKNIYNPVIYNDKEYYNPKELADYLGIKVAKLVYAIDNNEPINNSVPKYKTTLYINSVGQLSQLR